MEITISFETDLHPKRDPTGKDMQILLDGVEKALIGEPLTVRDQAVLIAVKALLQGIKEEVIKQSPQKVSPFGEN